MLWGGMIAIETFAHWRQTRGTDPQTVRWRAAPDPKRLADFRVLVVGAGFSGVGMGVKLKEAGIPFTIIEKYDDVGGTWYENTYPGIGVDTANHFYSNRSAERRVGQESVSTGRSRWSPYH